MEKKKAQPNEYARRKRELNKLNLDPNEYLKEVKKIAKETGM